MMNSKGLRKKGDIARNLVTSPWRRRPNLPSPKINHVPRECSVGDPYHQTAKTLCQRNTKSLHRLHKLRQTTCQIKHRFRKPRQANFKYASASQEIPNNSAPAVKQAQRRRKHGAEVLATTSVSRMFAKARNNGVQTRD